MTLLNRTQSASHLYKKGSASGQWGSLLRWPSLPTQLDFQSFAAKRGGITPDVEVREWVRDIWDVWFDEVFPPLEECDKHSTVVSHDQNESPELEIREIEKVDPSKTLTDGETVADLQAKLEALNETMAQQTTPNAFDVCRRGGLYKKLGLLSQAMEDLNQVNTATLCPYLSLCHKLT